MPLKVQSERVVNFMAEQGVRNTDSYPVMVLGGWSSTALRTVRRLDTVCQEMAENFATRICLGLWV